MQDDIVGVVRCYRETQEALRCRTLPASDVTTRLRLSKDSKTYRATRTKHKESQYEALLAAGRTTWHVGEHVRFYRSQHSAFVWIPDEADDVSPLSFEEELADSSLEEGIQQSSSSVPHVSADRRDYDVEHYLHILLNSYAERLHVAFEPEDFNQLFRITAQTGLFDKPIEQIQLRRIRCPLSGLKENV
jgi:hypothetical protein